MRRTLTNITLRSPYDVRDVRIGFRGLIAHYYRHRRRETGSARRQAVRQQLRERALSGTAVVRSVRARDTNRFSGKTAYTAEIGTTDL